MEELVLSVTWEEHPNSPQGSHEAAIICLNYILDNWYHFPEYKLTTGFHTVHGHGSGSIRFDVTLTATPQQHTKFLDRVRDFINNELNVIENGY